MQGIAFVCMGAGVCGAFGAMDALARWYERAGVHSCAKGPMANNKNRERQVIAAVACPDCRAPIGSLCRLRDERSRAGQGRPVLHKERRRAWQEWKREKGSATP